MYKGLPIEAVPYVLMADRESKVQTWWWILPEKSIETQTFQLRVIDEMGKESPLAGNSEKKAQIHHGLLTERLINVVKKVENYDAEGDCFDTPEQIKGLVERLEFLARGELSTAAQSASVLLPGIAKNWKSSSSM